MARSHCIVVCLIVLGVAVVYSGRQENRQINREFLGNNVLPQQDSQKTYKRRVARSDEDALRRIFAEAQRITAERIEHTEAPRISHFEGMRNIIEQALESLERDLGEEPQRILTEEYETGESSGGQQYEEEWALAEEELQPVQREASIHEEESSNAVIVDNPRVTEPQQPQQNGWYPIRFTEHLQVARLKYPEVDQAYREKSRQTARWCHRPLQISLPLQKLESVDCEVIEKKNRSGIPTRRSERLKSLRLRDPKAVQVHQNHSEESQTRYSEDLKSAGLKNSVSVEAIPEVRQDQSREDQTRNSKSLKAANRTNSKTTEARRKKNAERNKRFRERQKVLFQRNPKLAALNRKKLRERQKRYRQGQKAARIQKPEVVKAQL